MCSTAEARQALQNQKMLGLVLLGDGMGPLQSGGQEMVSEEVGAVGLFLQLVFIKPLSQPLPSGSQSSEDGQSEMGVVA